MTYFAIDKNDKGIYVINFALSGLLKRNELIA